MILLNSRMVYKTWRRKNNISEITFEIKNEKNRSIKLKKTISHQKNNISRVLFPLKKQKKKLKWHTKNN